MAVPLTSASVKVSYLAGDAGSPAIGPDGALYFSDTAALAVRRIGPDGIITTVAGPSTGAPFTQPAGSAFDTQGDLFIADYLGGGHGRIWRMDPTGQDHRLRRDWGERERRRRRPRPGGPKAPWSASPSARLVTCTSPTFMPIATSTRRGSSMPSRVSRGDEGLGR